ncbi:MAG: patatin-like phospholipase family protein [Candidatus Accumulibacter phosphatis]|jgi:patatin-like phospholipase/acyl hydrolase|uniref:Patatin n=1 Tax=Candidatus Accumulibacter contiguus TaxID=2954381 RepID=A0ABX1T4V5_9PROT|nr:patatin-like phospholipase family protein [Candidatus Accumulibacter contiguus]NMQ04026.1 patatin [Candidatus Accumulibacter contiguus]
MSRENLFRVLCLDGGGAKGFYTLGILREIEALIRCPLHERFDLIFGTSTGSIIASMLALGKSVHEIIALYQEHVPTVMQHKNADGRSGALANLSKAIFKDAMFTDVKTNVGVVTTKWVLEQPMIFKGNIAQAHGRQGSFVPGFGVKVGEAVQASCSAYPYFNRKAVTTSNGDNIELIDGGFCANNPTLYAIADATISMQVPSDDIRVVSLGCGNYPPRPLSKFTLDYWKQRTPGVQLLQKTLEINVQSMEQLRTILYKHIQTVRINQSFSEPAMATDLFEHDLKKLNVLTQRGVHSYAEHEEKLKAFLC